MNIPRFTIAARVLAVLLAAMLLAAGAGWAQTKSAPPAKPGAKSAPLSAQQRKELRKIALDAAAGASESRAALHKARLEIQRLMLEDRPDAAALDRKAAEVGELQGRLLRTRLEARMKMRAVLTPEQRDQWGSRLWLHSREGRGRRGLGRLHDMGPRIERRIRILNLDRDI